MKRSLLYLLCLGIFVGACKKDDKISTHSPSDPMQHILSASSALLEAVQAGNTEDVKQALKDGADVNAKDKHNTTALMFASLLSSADILNILLEAGAETDIQEAHKGWTALMFAADQGPVEAVRSLVFTGADIQIQNHAQKKAIDLALARQDGARGEIAGLLLDFLGVIKSGNFYRILSMHSLGVDVNTRGRKDTTAFMVAAMHSDDFIMEILFLLFEQDFALDVQEKVGGSTALMMAARHHPAKSINLLIDGGADPQITNYNGQKAIDLAIKRSDAAKGEVIGLLVDLLGAIKRGEYNRVAAMLRSGANVNTKNSHGTTALMLAAQLSDTRILDLLIQEGAQVNAKDTEDWTALMYAARYGSVEAVRHLLDASAQADALNGTNERAIDLAAKRADSDPAKAPIITLLGGVLVQQERDLYKAIKNKQPNRVRQLIQAGVNVNAKGRHDTTALIIAALYNSDPEITGMLLDAGADINAKESVGGRNALLAAAKDNKILDMVNKLINAPGVNLKIKDNNDMNALMWAARQTFPTLDRNWIHRSPNSAIVNAIIEKIKEQHPTEVADIINTRDNDGTTALMYSGIHGTAEGIEAQKILNSLLALPGIDINAIDNYGWTALMYAVKGSNKEPVTHTAIVSTLVERIKTDHPITYADIINVQNKIGQTALMWAVIGNSHAKIVKMLLQVEGIRLDLATPAKRNVFSYLYPQYRPTATVKAIVDKINTLPAETARKIVNLQEAADWETTLMNAIIRSTEERVLELLRVQQLDLNICDYHKKTALDYLNERGRPKAQIEQIFRDRGAQTGTEACPSS